MPYGSKIVLGHRQSTAKSLRLFRGYSETYHGKRITTDGVESQETQNSS